MKIVYNNFLPFKGYIAMTVWPFIFVRKEFKGKIDTKEMNLLISHENIHGRQQIEMFFLFFYIWYGWEYLLRYIECNGDHSLAYNRISFEVEAYMNAANPDYLKTRKWYSFLNYL